MYSIPFGLSVAIQLFTHYFDKIASIRFLDTVEYAIYATAFLSIPGINQIYESLCQVNVVNMSKGYQEGNLHQVRELYRDFVVKTLSFSTPVILAVSLFAEEVISFLYPSEYIEAAYYFRIYSLTFLTAMLGAGTILRAIGKTQYSLVSYAAAALVGIPATYCLVKTYGIHGAIWGAVINMVLPRIIQMFYEARQTESTILNYLDWKNIGFVLGWGLVLLIPLFVIKLMFHPSIWICIILSGLYVIATYLVYVKKDLFLLSQETVYGFLRKLKR
jgi:O-antigen/teichoic acid export membrane protein